MAKATLHPRIARHGLHRGVCLLASSVLWFAALAKGYQLAHEPVVGSRLLLILQVEFEWLLGLMLLSGLYRRLVWLVAIVSFTSFSLFSTYQIIQGSASCGCFGAVTVSPWLTLVLDLVILTLLIVARPRVKEPSFMSDQPLRHGLVALIALVVGLSAAWFMAGYTPATLAEDGQIIGDTQQILLEPEKWQGKVFALAEHIDIGDQLTRGAWTVVLYHHDCPDCQSLWQQWAKQPADTQVAWVEIPPYGDAEAFDGHDGDIVKYGRLTNEREWFVTTPVVVRLTDGIVRHAEIRRAATGNKQSPATTTKAKRPSRDRHDFGYVEPGSVHQAQFLIDNPLDKPLTIYKVQAECACTQVANAPQVIAAGQSALLDVTFAAPDVHSNYAKRIFVHTDHPQLAKITLTVAARIGMPLRIEPAVLDLGSLDEGESIKRTLTVFNDGKEPVRILYGTSDLADCVARVPRLTVEPGASSEIPIVVSTERKNEGVYVANISIRTNLEAQTDLQMQVRYQISQGRVAIK